MFLNYVTIGFRLPRSDLLTESEGKNPNLDKVFFLLAFFFFFFLILSFFLSPQCALSLSQCLLAHTFAHFTLRHRQGKNRGIIENPVCEANNEIIVMCGRKWRKKCFYWISGAQKHYGNVAVNLGIALSSAIKAGLTLFNFTHRGSWKNMTNCYLDNHL